MTTLQQRSDVEQDQPEPIMRWFAYEHLHEDLQDVSRMFSNLAHEVASRLPRSAERSVALRKLLEAKDAAVRGTMVDRSR